MADYVKTNPNSKKGDLMISRQVFESLATEAVNHVKGVALAKKSFKLSKPVQAIFQRNGRVKIAISINIDKSANANDVCVKIEESVANILMAYTESVPFDVNINILEIV